MSSRIFVPLASDPFWRFKKGSKGVEVRAFQSPVARAVRNHDMGTPVNLRRGYSTSDNIWGRLGLWVIADNVESLPVEFRIAADLPEQRRTDYYDPDQKVVAFQVLDTPHWETRTSLEEP